jgi:hypothetical protein
MTRPIARGTLFRCPVCGAEIVMLSRRQGDFQPRCCNREMQPLARRVVFYVCPVCRAEIAVLIEGRGILQPRCCNRDMIREAA